MIKKIKDSAGVEHQIDYNSLANLPSGPVTLPDRGAVIQLAAALISTLPTLASDQKHTIEFTSEGGSSGEGSSLDSLGIKKEYWTFELDTGSTVTKSVVVGI